MRFVGRALEALAELGGKAAIDWVAKAADDRHADVRVCAASTLARLGDAGALPTLLSMRADADPNVCDAAAQGVRTEPHRD